MPLLHLGDGKSQEDEGKKHLEDIEESTSGSNQVEEEKSPEGAADNNQSGDAGNKTEADEADTKKPDESKTKVSSEPKLYDTSELVEVEETDEDEYYRNSGVFYMNFPECNAEMYYLSLINGSNSSLYNIYLGQYVGYTESGEQNSRNGDDNQGDSETKGETSSDKGRIEGKKLVIKGTKGRGTKIVVAW